MGLGGFFSGLPVDGWVNSLWVMGAGLLLGAGAIVFLAGSQRAPRRSPNRARVPWESNWLPGWVRSGVTRWSEGLTTLRGRPREVTVIVLLSLASALLDSAVYFCLFLSLGATVPFGRILMGYAMLALTFLIPAAPGYLGSVEAYGSVIFTALGVQRDTSAAAMVLYHGLNAILLGLTGGPALWSLRRTASAGADQSHLG
jgi:uncharacterized membrane protein YbhN (UPF0104 family)